MAYNVLSIRSPKDEPDPLYPSIGDGGKTVTVTPSVDGENRPHFAAVDLSVWELHEGDNKFHRLGHFGGTSHTIFLTDCRTIVLSPNFKKADAGYLMFDLPGFYLASALTAAIKTHGRALTGQVMHYNVFKLSVVGTGRMKEGNRIRMYLRDETEGTERQIFLQITLRLGTDPRPIAQQIARRIAGYWLQPNVAKTLDPERKATLGELANAPLLEPTGEEWKSYQFPFSAGVVLKGENRTIHKVPAVTATERLVASGETCRPAFRWLDFSRGAPPLPTGWGVRFTSTRSITPSQPGPNALVGSCDPRGMYLADRSSRLPVESNGQRRVLYSGKGMYVVTGDYLLTYVMHGNTLVGSVDRKDESGRLIAATPLREIASIGVTRLVIEKDRGLVDKGVPAAVAIFPRDRTWGATWITNAYALVKGDEGSKLEPLAPQGLAEQLVAAVSGATGGGTPPKLEVVSGYIYDLAGALDARASSDGQDAAKQASCGSCGLGEGPQGYPCFGCGGTLG